MDAFSRTIDILKRGEAKEIAERRCFVLRRSDFLELFTLIIECQWPIEPDDELMTKHGFENTRISLSSADKSTYFACTEAEQLIDKLWEEKKR